MNAVLDELTVTNLGLIAGATVAPGPGLVVITGETGTGKTLLLGALRLLRGEQATRDVIGPEGEGVVVAGRFFVDDDEIVLSRQVTAGRSRAYRDGAMVPARALAEATVGIVEIVGQHDHLRLAERAGVRATVDGALDAAGTAAAAAYRAAWEGLQTLEDRRRLLGGDLRSLERELDVVRFQADEITGAGFRPGDDADLETRALRLRNGESIAEHLAAAIDALGEEGAASGLDAGARRLELAARSDPSLRPLVTQLSEVVALLGEVSAELASAVETMERDPEALQHVEERLAELAELRRKYGDDLEAILDFGRQATQRAAELSALLHQAGEIDDAVTEARRSVEAAGVALTAARRHAADRVERDSVAHLAEMGLTDPIVSFVIEDAEPGASGCDTVSLLFSSDRALPPGPVARASGGELSRLVLALRLATGVADAPVIAFDEIDAGVGGATALAVGAKLAALAEGRQVLCVTHLPQVAAHASTHLVVRRNGRTATVAAVDGEERIEELTRMLSGLPDSDKGKSHAAELLELAGRGG